MKSTPQKKKNASVRKVRSSMKPVKKEKSQSTRKTENSPSYVVIVNPASGGGKTKKRWPEMEKIFREELPNSEIIFTAKRLEATEITRRKIRAGAKVIVAVGGDGTISEVVAGFFEENGKPLKPLAKAPSLGIVAGGSGSDLIRTLGIPRDFMQSIATLKTDKPHVLDAGHITYKNFDGKPAGRVFINVADVGIGGEVIEILEKQGKALGGFISYQLATLRGLLKYRNKNMKITLDSKKVLEGLYNGVVVANGKYFGSGMKIAPGANPTDGLFDVVLLKAMSKWKMIAKAGKLRKGTHVDDKDVEVTRARTIRVETVQKALVEIDGELPGTAPVEFKILPRAIKVLMPG